MKNKMILAICTVLCVALLCVSLVACNTDDEKQEATTFVSLDINPSIELTLDENNKVMSVYGANEDGQVLLYAEEGIIGADVEVAVEKITSLAIELGYLDEDNAVVQTSVTSAKDGVEESVLSKVNAKITATANELQLNVSCDGETAYSLLRKLEQLKAQYPDNEDIQALTPAQFKLVVSASETGEVSIEAAVTLDKAQLVQIINNAHEEAKEFATSAYNEVKAQASAMYDKAVGVAIDGIYASYYIANRPLNSYYGVAYQGYKYSSRVAYAVATALEYAENACDYPLDEAQISAVAVALGLGENVDVLKNSDGDITVNSIYAYADKLFKNSEANAEIEEIKAELNSALDSVEGTLQEMIDELSKEYEGEITAVKESLQTIVDQIEGIVAMLPESMRTMLDDVRELVDDATEIIADGKIKSQEVREFGMKLEAKSNDMLVKIENDLTDEELAEVKEMQAKAEEKLASAKAEMDEAIAEAEAQAKEKLASLKAERTADQQA